MGTVLLLMRIFGSCFRLKRFLKLKGDFGDMSRNKNGLHRPVVLLAAVVLEVSQHAQPKAGAQAKEGEQATVHEGSEPPLVGISCRVADGVDNSSCQVDNTSARSHFRVLESAEEQDHQGLWVVLEALCHTCAGPGRRAKQAIC